jgi:hypothetical protein
VTGLQMPVGPNETAITEWWEKPPAPLRVDHVHDGIVSAALLDELAPRQVGGKGLAARCSHALPAFSHWECDASQTPCSSEVIWRMGDSLICTTEWGRPMLNWSTTVKPPVER